jgi:hypothetical protein
LEFNLQVVLGRSGVIRKGQIRKNEAKLSGIRAALSHLAEMRHGATEWAEILFKKTLTQTGGFEKLTAHTE